MPHDTMTGSELLIQALCDATGFTVKLEEDGNGFYTILRPDRPWWERAWNTTAEVIYFLTAAVRGQTISPDEFVSDFDAIPCSQPNYREEQYRKARQMAEEGAIFYIARNRVWSAEIRSLLGADMGVRSHGSVMSYEVLGGHRDTDALVRGWLDGGGVIIRYDTPERMEDA